MPLPDLLQTNLNTFLEQFDIPTLEKASFQLSEKYRSCKKLSSYEEHIAYLIARLPATYETVLKVLKGLSFLPTPSILDLGAGPGTVGWAAGEVWKTPLQLTSVESDPLFIKLAITLGSQSRWIEQDLQTLRAIDSHDLIVLSYSLGELSDLSFLKRFWPFANRAVVIIEPGTPKGYSKMLEARQILIEQGGHIWAPCPHNCPCPLPSDDWCHFYARVERGYLHRKVKKGILPFEDEKFSYCIVGKEPPAHRACRILREPERCPGHVKLFLCCPEGLERRTVSRKEGVLYKKARKASWGDTLDIQK